jgi:hypothetical protein
MKVRAIIFCSLIIVDGCSSRLSLGSHLEKNRQYFILTLEKADLYFLREDVLSVAKTKEARESVVKSKDEYDQMLSSVENLKFDTLSFPIRLNVKTDEVTANAHLFVVLSYVDLLNKGKVLVLNKSSEVFENKISIKKVRSKSGTRISYRFQNGQEFYDDVVSIID